MADATVVLGETRLWAGSRSSQWAGSPAAADDGPGLPVPLVPALLAAVFASVLARLGLRAATGPVCGRLTVATPSHWGTRRLAAVAAAGDSVAEQVVLQPWALRAVQACGCGGTDCAGQLVAVVELGALTTTATLVARTEGRLSLTACEHEPTVGAADLDDDLDTAVAAIAAVVARLVAERCPDHLVVVECAEPTRVAALRSAIAAVCAADLPVAAISGEELARDISARAVGPAPQEDSSLREDTEPREDSVPQEGSALQRDWAREVPLLQRGRLRQQGPAPQRGSALQQDTEARREPASGSETVRPGAVPLWASARCRVRYRDGALCALGAAALVAVALVAGTVATHNDWRSGPTVGQGESRVWNTGGAPPGPATAMPGSQAGDAQAAPVRMLGRVHVRVPAGWHAVSQAGPRLDVVPDNGLRQRLTVVQRQLTGGAGIDDVARDLSSQIATKDPNRLSGFRGDAPFGDRHGLAYEEYPGDGTTVTWHVLVEAGLQVSVGCQSDSGRGQLVASVCDRFVRDVAVDP